LLSRRDVRTFEDRLLEPGVLERILEAGRRAPSSQNWQPWNFVAVVERPALAELAKVWKGAAHVEHSAATIALTAHQYSDQQQANRLHYDLGQATIYMMLAALDQGVGSGHSVVEDQDLARQVLALGEDEWCPYLVVLGYPTRPLRPIQHPDRRAFDDVSRLVGPSDDQLGSPI
jgi:nitroreductase